jgi:hypothetical protein
LEPAVIVGILIAPFMIAANTEKDLFENLKQPQVIPYLTTPPPFPLKLPHWE